MQGKCEVDGCLRTIKIDSPVNRDDLISKYGEPVKIMRPLGAIVVCP